MTVSRTNSAASGIDLLVDLDRAAALPLHRQLEISIRGAIRDGRLPHGAPLPATRALAADLGVSRGVVVEAYQQLAAEGYVTSRSGGYTRVATAASRRTSATSRARSRSDVLVDFGYGRADAASFPRTAWLRALRTALTGAPNERLGYLDGHGAVELRTALADYLDRVRGTLVDPDAVVITTGFAQGVRLLVQVSAAAGARTLAVEDPSPTDDARVVAAEVGMAVVGVPVDGDGIDVAALARTAADVVVVTPSHQWPTGAVLSARRRAALVAWARERDAIVLEDDYDAEYRHHRAAVGALQGLAPDRVAYAGTVSKTLAPGLRIGWLVLPPRLVEPVAAAKLRADRGSPVIDQLALAHFLTTGQFDRHLRRTRPLYRRRRDALVDALARILPDLEPAGIAAGLHLVAWLPDDLDEAAVVAAAARYGLRIAGITPYRLSPGRGGLIFGYSNLDERAVVRGVDLLAAAVAEVRRAR